VTDYIYGIRNRRDGEIHRDNMTAEQARDFMDPEDWAPVDPTRLYEIVRRPLGDWETVK
jgi:hypothetical protein